MNRVPSSVITPNASRHRRVRETLTARSSRTSALVVAGRAVLIVTYLAVNGRAGSPESSDRSSALTGSRIGACEGTATCSRPAWRAPRIRASSRLRSSAALVPVSTVWSMLLTHPSHAGWPSAVTCSAIFFTSASRRPETASIP